MKMAAMPLKDVIRSSLLTTASAAVIVWPQSCHGPIFDNNKPTLSWHIVFFFVVDLQILTGSLCLKLKESAIAWRSIIPFNPMLLIYPASCLSDFSPLGSVHGPTASHSFAV